MLENLKNYNVILGSSSPRRIELLKSLNIDFVSKKIKVDESIPDGMAANQVARYLAEKKSSAFDIDKNDLLITADTVVIHNDKIFGKPQNRQDAIDILNNLNNSVHCVSTAICLRYADEIKLFQVDTDVYFAELTQEEIAFYVDHYKPFDKAGAYGIQEWIGYVGVEKIIGSYYNVMGFPLKELYQNLKQIKVLEVDE